MTSLDVADEVAHETLLFKRPRLPRSFAAKARNNSQKGSHRRFRPESFAAISFESKPARKTPKPQTSKALPLPQLSNTKTTKPQNISNFQPHSSSPPKTTQQKEPPAGEIPKPRFAEAAPGWVPASRNAHRTPRSAAGTRSATPRPLSFCTKSHACSYGVKRRGHHGSSVPKSIATWSLGCSCCSFLCLGQFSSLSKAEVDEVGAIKMKQMKQMKQIFPLGEGS